MAKTYMLDTETTGLNVDQGDRLIEIGVVEYDGMSATGRTYHTYVNPGDRQVQAGAIAVHGITNEMLKDAPAFADIADDFLDFIGDHPLVIYNAGFDLGFLNAELEDANMAPIDNEIIDGLDLAKKRFPGGKNTLDVVAKKLGVDTSARDKHGAIVDSIILGEVYRRLVQQNEMMVDVVQEPVRVAATGDIEAKPLLRVPGVSGRHLVRGETSYTLFGSVLTPKTLASEAARHGYASAMAFAEACKAWHTL